MLRLVERATGSHSNESMGPSQGFLALSKITCFQQVFSQVLICSWEDKVLDKKEKGIKSHNFFKATGYILKLYVLVDRFYDAHAH